MGQATIEIPTTLASAGTTALGDFAGSHVVAAKGRRGLLRPRDTEAGGRQARSPARPPESLPELDALLWNVAAMKAITPQEATDIKRALRDLRARGAGAVPAIRDFLRRGDDVDFTRMSGGELVGHRTLRQAMIDTLDKIGGREATRVSLEQIRQTSEPIELALLARSLESEEPGVHRTTVLQAVDHALQRIGQTPARELPDVGPLFDLLRTHGGSQAVAVLERSVPEWGEYALIALAGVSGGAGIPSLTALASAGDAPVVDPALPFQVLAQATVRHGEAADALITLARAGQIPDQAWAAVGEALGGKHLDFAGSMFAGTPLAPTGRAHSNRSAPLWKSYYIEWLNIRYEQDVVSAGWSAKRVERQLALIDELLDATSSSAALRALQQARASLEYGRRT